MPALAGSSGYPKVLFSDLDRTLLAHNYTIHPRVDGGIADAIDWPLALRWRQ
jgi:hypothetical protein